MIKVYKVSTPAPDIVLFFLKGKGKNEMLQVNTRNYTFKKWRTTPDLPPSAEYIGEIPEKWDIRNLINLYKGRKKEKKNEKIH
jgi:hypothetical protein